MVKFLKVLLCCSALQPGMCGVSCRQLNVFSLFAAWEGRYRPSGTVCGEEGRDREEPGRMSQSVTYKLRSSTDSLDLGTFDA